MALKLFRFWTQGRVYGFIGSTLLFAYFIVPPSWDLANRACQRGLHCEPIEAGIVPVLIAFGAYCLGAGYFISRIVDAGPQDRPTAGAVFVLAVSLFGGLMRVLFQAAFW